MGYTQPLDSSLDFFRGYLARQILVQVYPAANDRTVRTIGWRRCLEASKKARINCSEFTLGMSTGFRDELAGLAHPLSESEEE
jgi:hypothetical protein